MTHRWMRQDAFDQYHIIHTTAVLANDNDDDDDKPR